MPKKQKDIKYASLKKLHLDSENPRLPQRIAQQGEMAVQEYMAIKANIVELMRSIGENDYFPGEPLLVVPIKKGKSEYTVVEGNRRLCALKLLKNPRLVSVKTQAILTASKEATFKPDPIPVIIFNSRDGILNYLGYRHITGIKAWDP